jgi:hypothetical protein
MIFCTGAAVASTSAPDTKSVKHTVVLVHGAFANVGGRIVGSFWTPSGTEFEQIYVLAEGSPGQACCRRTTSRPTALVHGVCEGADRVRLS